jgi:hypothetical protein
MPDAQGRRRRRSAGMYVEPAKFLCYEGSKVLASEMQDALPSRRAAELNRCALSSLMVAPSGATPQVKPATKLCPRYARGAALLGSAKGGAGAVWLLSLPQTGAPAAWQRVVYERH